MGDKKAGPGSTIFISAIITGVAGEILFTGNGWGVGAALWMAGLAILGLSLKKKKESSGKQADQLLFIPLILLSLCFIWRDALFLNIATIIGLLTISGLIMHSNQATNGVWSTIKTPSIFQTCIRSCAGFWGNARAEVHRYRTSPIIDKTNTQHALRGVLLAMPCLAIFGLLLSSADKAFGVLLANIVEVEVFQIPAKIFWITFFTIAAGTFLYGTLSQVKTKPSVKSNFSIGVLEISIILGLINLMFLTFVAMQMGYLFGGIDYIEGPAGITLKSYTRRGFFELVTVAALALPLLMALQRFFKPSSSAHILYFNMLAGLQVAMLLIMLVSAGQRMWLYTSTTGITELRFYSSVFMIWLAFVLGWFAWTSLRGLRLRFVRGSALAGVAMVLCLNIMNPDAVILKINLYRAAKGVTYNGDTLKYLATDAIPVAIEAFPNLRPKERQLISEGLNHYQSHNKISGWRDWNYAKHVAITESADFLEQPLEVMPTTSRKNIR